MHYSNLPVNYFKASLELTSAVRPCRMINLCSIIRPDVSDCEAEALAYKMYYGQRYLDCPHFQKRILITMNVISLSQFQQMRCVTSGFVVAECFICFTLVAIGESDFLSLKLKHRQDKNLVPFLRYFLREIETILWVGGMSIFPYLFF